MVDRLNSSQLLEGDGAATSEGYGKQLERLQSLFPPFCGSSIATSKMYDTDLHPDEAPYVAKAVLGRRREYAAGRAAAREVLKGLGGPSIAIPTASDRTPVWPDGFVGSISHTQGVCCAVVARTTHLQGLGVDVELVRPLPHGVASLVFDPSEQAELEQMADAARLPWDIIGFSAKEAFFKCYYPRTRRFLDFHDVRLTLSVGPNFDEGGFAVSFKDSRVADGIDKQIVGRWNADETLVFAGAILG